MQRPPHGGTTRPGPVRPGYGYGRPIRGCPREIGPAEHPPWLDPAWWPEDDGDRSDVDARHTSDRP